MKGERRVSALAAGYGLHPTMTHQWKKALLRRSRRNFERGGQKAPEVAADTVPALHAKIRSRRLPLMATLGTYAFPRMDKVKVRQ
jgi:transposase-like protein